MTVITPKNIFLWLFKSLEDKEGHPDGKRITSCLAFVIAIVIAFADQFFGKPLNLYVFFTFVVIAISGLGFEFLLTMVFQLIDKKKEA